MTIDDEGLVYIYFSESLVIPKNISLYDMNVL